MPVRIILPDHSEKVFDHEPTALEVASSIGARLAQDTLGVRVNGSPEIQDLRLPLKDGSRVELITTKSERAVEVIRHSAAHIMAQAVQALWPDVKVTIGPVIENGFYYDFDSPRTFSEADFASIEDKMREIIKADYPIVKEVWSTDKAVQTFAKMGERFKVEIIKDLGEKEVSIYHQGPWFDLCRGPHVQRTGQIGAVKLMSVAGAYWRGDEKNPMLQRIYATAFRNSKELSEYLQQLEEAKRRDHRKLGKEMGLFHFHDWAPGSPFFTGKGSIIYTELQNYLREVYFKNGYQEVITPQIFDLDLFKTSGHAKNYAENMYFTRVDERDFGVKPMNCPGHCLFFSMDWHSYRDLPLRVADFGRLHRFEKSGTMHGLSRVRTFCQDDAHVFCTREQVQTEIETFVKLLTQVYRDLGMDSFQIYLSTRPEKRMGSDAGWDWAESILQQSMKAMNIPFDFNPGDGAFYGPKLDVMFVDAIKRRWQLGTLQVDFNLPDAFNLKYSGEDNQEHRPVMLHRAIFGSLERFISVYLEHTAGHLPLWLSPIQVRILNVTDRSNVVCEQILQALRSQGVRAEFDRRNEKLNYKIREAQLQRIPQMWILGDQEVENGTVSVRHSSGQLENGLKVEIALERIQELIKSRALNTSKGEKIVTSNSEVVP